MIRSVLGSAYRVTKNTCRQTAHPADLRPPQASIWGKDLNNLPDSTSQRQTRLHQPRESHSSPIDHLP
jgi:hypothetical protein